MFDDREVIAEIVSTKFIGQKKKEKKRRGEQFSEWVHCYNPTPPIGRRRPKNVEVEMTSHKAFDVRYMSQEDRVVH